MSDAHLFEILSRTVLQAGLAPAVVTARWTGLRRAFGDFEPESAARLTEAQLEVLAADPALLRNRPKLRAVVLNARTVAQLRAGHGSFAAWVWGLEERPYEQRLEILADTFERVGARSAHLVLEAVGLARPDDWQHFEART